MNLCRAGALCVIADRRGKETDGEKENDAVGVLPLYLRPSQADRLFRERQGK